MINGLDKLEKNNDQEKIDLAYCQEQNLDIKSNHSPNP
jgi:hypothetical protein